jgi:hypothetical protein
MEPATTTGTENETVSTPHGIAMDNVKTKETR